MVAPNSLSSWNLCMPEAVLIFNAASLHAATHRLNFVLVCPTLYMYSKFRAVHRSFTSSITFV